MAAEDFAIAQHDQLFRDLRWIGTPHRRQPTTDEHRRQRDERNTA
jgi:hypothetical protein